MSTLPTIPDTLPGPFARRLRSFQYHLQGGAVRSDRTIATYLEGMILLGHYLAAQNHSGIVEQITVEDLRKFLAHLAEQKHHRTGQPLSASTLNNRGRAVQAFFRWAATEYEIPNPMDKVVIPKPADVLIPHLEADDLRLLLQAAAGKDFLARRDTAFLRLGIDSGARLSELALIRTDALDLQMRRVRVNAKGSQEHVYMFGSKTVAALDRYLDMRDSHAQADSGQLWISRFGGMTVSGCYQIVRDRAHAAAKLTKDPAQAERLLHTHPHTLRHSAAIRYLERGGQQDNLNTLMNWRSPTMTARYTRTAKRRLAEDEYKRLGMGDDL